MGRQGLKPIQNEMGIAAIISVMALSLVMVATLSALYTYLVNRSKFQKRIKMVYEMTYATEELSKFARTAYDRAENELSKLPPLSGNQDQQDHGVNQSNAEDDQRGLAAANCPGGWEDYGGVSYCFPDANRCVNMISKDRGGPDTNATMQACLNFTEDENFSAFYINKKSFVAKWYKRLDQFFDTTISKNNANLTNQVLAFGSYGIYKPTMWGWLLPQAHAIDSSPPEWLEPSPPQYDEPSQYYDDFSGEDLNDYFPGMSQNNGVTACLEDPANCNTQCSADPDYVEGGPGGLNCGKVCDSDIANMFSFCDTGQSGAIGLLVPKCDKVKKFKEAGDNGNATTSASSLYDNCEFCHTEYIDDYGEAVSDASRCAKLTYCVNSRVNTGEKFCVTQTVKFIDRE